MKLSDYNIINVVNSGRKFRAFQFYFRK